MYSKHTLAPARTGLDCIKIPESNISCLCPFKKHAMYEKERKAPGFPARQVTGDEILCP